MARLVVLAAALGAAAGAQAPESSTHWRYFKQVATDATSGLVTVDLDRETLAAAREDHGDVRLRDAEGREIPYAFRIRNKDVRTERLEAREFDRGVRGDSAEISLDLGPDTAPHNELAIDTGGSGFRRRVRILGSDDGLEWAALGEPAFLYRFESPRYTVDETVLPYPESRRRYLKAEVEADEHTDESAPQITTASVRLSYEAPARNQEFPLRVPAPTAVRDEQRPASEFVLDLEGRLPVRGLRLSVSDEAFSRPYRLEFEGERRARVAASGTLGRRADEDADDVTVEFAEVAVDELTLKVVDDRNPPLEIERAVALVAARELIFDPAAGEAPFRLEFGNPQAAAPHYDFAASVPRASESAAAGTLGPIKDNPRYDPSSEPLGERAPWLAYLALGAVCAALFAILWRTLPRSAEARSGEPPDSPDAGRS